MRSARNERRAQPLETCAVGGDHVEAAGRCATGVRKVLPEIALRGAHHAPLLAPVDARRGAAEALAAAQTHLDEDQHRAIPGDHVEFAVAKAHLARDHATAVAFQQRAGRRLRSVTGALASNSAEKA